MQNYLISKDWIQNISYGSGLVIPLHGLVLVSVVGNWSTYTSNWIMKDPKTNQFNIWYADHWHHLCICYTKATSSISIVKVSLLLCLKGLVTIR